MTPTLYSQSQLLYYSITPNEPLAHVRTASQFSQHLAIHGRFLASRDTRENQAMSGLEGAILIPILILGCSAIIYYGMISVRARQLEARRGDDSSSD